MKINELELKVISGDFCETTAENDSEKEFFFKNEDEFGISFYHKSKTQPNIVYAFHCDKPNVWCVLVEQLEVI